jgi:hypothetical protein
MRINVLGLCPNGIYVLKTCKDALKVKRRRKTAAADNIIKIAPYTYKCQSLSSIAFGSSTLEYGCAKYAAMTINTPQTAANIDAFATTTAMEATQ